MKFSKHAFTALIAVTFLTSATSPAQAHGGIETIFFAGLLQTFFYGLAFIAALIALAIVAYVSYLLTRVFSGKRVGLINILAVIVLCPVFYFIYFVGSTWHRVLSKPHTVDDATLIARELAEFDAPPAGQVPPIRPESAAKAQRMLRSAEESVYDSFDLGKMYRRGDGVKQDFAESYFWLSISLLMQPSPEWYPRGAADARDDSRRRLSADQAAAVDARIAAWQKNHPKP